MKIKILYLLICIKFLLVQSTIADEKEITVKFEKPPFRTDPLTHALLKIQSYEDLCRNWFLNRKQNHEKFLKRFNEEDNYDHKIIIIIDFTEYIVKDIENSVTLLDNTKTYFMKSNGTLPRRDSILGSLYLVSQQVIAFQKLIRDLSHIGTGDAVLQDKWNQTIIISLQYTNLMKDMVDKSIIETLVSTKDKLMETRSIMELNKRNLDLNIMEREF